MIDALESVKLVTATGDLVTASKTENPDLFWGIRGAGWNFGIVVEATYQVFDATNNGQVLEGDMAFPASVNQSIWENLKALDDTLPEILSLTLILAYNAATDEVRPLPTAAFFTASN
jgi:FAD/FMN-containing dehydrogenase